MALQPVHTSTIARFGMARLGLDEKNACSHRSSSTNPSSLFLASALINYAIILLVHVIRNGNGACDSLFPVFSDQILCCKKTGNAEEVPSTG